MSFRISCRSFLSGHLQPVDKETSCICFRTGKFSEPPRLSPASRWAVLKFLIPSTLQIMCKMLRIINIFFQGEVIYEFKSFTRFGALFFFFFFFFLSSPWSSERAGAGWWGREEDMLLAPESEFQLRAAYSPSPARQRPALVPSVSRLRPGGHSGLSWPRPPPHPGCPVEFSVRNCWAGWGRKEGLRKTTALFSLGQKGRQRGALCSRKRFLSLDLVFPVPETRPPLFFPPPLTGISWGAGTRDW